MKLAFILDVETTSLIENHTVKLDRQPHIIEFFGQLVDLETGETTNELDILIKPPISIPEEIVKITGITDAMVEDHYAFDHFKDEIQSRIESSPSEHNQCIIAHNAAFDKEALDIEFERLGIQIKWPKVICTVEQTIHVKGFRLNLSGLHELLFGEPFAGAHRAKADVAALTRCCVEIYHRGWL